MLDDSVLEEGFATANEEPEEDYIETEGSVPTDSASKVTHTASLAPVFLVIARKIGEEKLRMSQGCCLRNSHFEHGFIGTSYRSKNCGFRTWRLYLTRKRCRGGAGKRYH